MTVKNISTLAILFGLIVLPAGSYAATYYVDSASGSDAADGRSAETALRSTAAVNQLPLNPGDSVLFRRTQSFDGTVEIRASGDPGQPISFGAFGTGNDRPLLYGFLFTGDHVIVDDIDIDHRKDASDAIRIRGARNVTFRNMMIRNGTNDAIDADQSDGLTVEYVEIHHFLNGSYGSKDDSHGVAITSTDGVTIRNTNIHHVSGDSIQTDPNRTAGSISDNIVIQDSIFWTGPLSQNFNAGWPAGASPGENALDTKVLKSGYENEIRMKLSLTNVTAYGWTAVPEISNRAVFNLKEKIDVTLNRITVYDSEIAFRVRGGLGNADTLIANTVIYDVGTAVRAEDNVTGLRVYNSTFGHGVGDIVRHAGGSGGTGSWDWLNNAFIDPILSEADHSSNKVASATDFTDSSLRDYRLAADSPLIDAGIEIPALSVDRSGATRNTPYDVGAFEHQHSAKKPNPPILD